MQCHFAPSRTLQVSRQALVYCNFAHDIMGIASYLRRRDRFYRGEVERWKNPLAGGKLDNID